MRHPVHHRPITVIEAVVLSLIFSCTICQALPDLNSRQGDDGQWNSSDNGQWNSSDNGQWNSSDDGQWNSSDDGQSDSGDNDQWDTSNPIDLSNFPSCAKANCIKSEQLTPARLGCLTPNLTTKCLCTEAVTPLSCAPSGPSDEDNCWYDLETWYLSACQGQVAVLSSASMPSCILDCMSFWLVSQGCRSMTRNCFCMLRRKTAVDAASACVTQNCSSNLPEDYFDPSIWRDRICSLGKMNYYADDPTPPGSFSAGGPEPTFLVTLFVISVITIITVVI